MAITKTTSLVRIEVNYNEDPATVLVTTNTVWDDPDDAELPIERGESKLIKKTTETITFDETTGEPITSSSATDYSGEDARVVAICDAVWS